MSIENGILYRLPFLQNPVCPYCKEKITHNKEAHLLISDTNGNQTIFYKTDIPYCKKCKMPFATNLLLNKLQYETGRKPETITLKKKDYLIQEIGRVPKKMQKLLDRTKKTPFRIIEGYKPKEKEINRIICNHSFRNICPVCGYTLQKKELYIPVALTHQAIMRGAYCSWCKRFFTHHSRWSIHKLLDGNTFAERFIFDEHDPADDIIITERKKQEAEARRKRQLEQIEKSKKEAEAKQLQEKKDKENKLYFENHPSTAFILTAVFPDSEQIIRIVDKKAEESKEENIFRYNTETGREFLSAAFADQRNNAGNIDGKTFRITETLHSTNNIFGKKIKNGDREFIRIEKDGGNFSSVFHDLDCILADLLLYAPFTNRLEIMPSTYNKKKDYYYTDIRHYREFIQKFGKPDIFLEFIPNRSRSGNRNFSDLNIQSFLNAYGYTVNINDNLSAQYRQTLLAEIVDLGFLTIREICDYLDFFITTHTSDKDDIARAKWEEDLLFISTYRYNPERFLIAPE